MPRGRVITPDFWTDENIIALSPFARLLYIGLWNFAYCDKGHLPDEQLGLKLKILPNDPVSPDELFAELFARGRVVRMVGDNGKTFLAMPAFETHQKKDERWKTRCPACAQQDSLNHAETPASFSEPAETHQSSALREEERREPERKGDEIVANRDDIESLCFLLASLIEENGSKRPTITKAWLDAARLLIDKDGRNPEAAAALIRWAQADNFWRGNILSMPKFREKYDQLRLKRDTQPAAQKSKAQVRTENNLNVVAMFAAQEKGALEA